MRPDVVIEFANGRRASVPGELMRFVDWTACLDAGMWPPSPCADCGWDTFPRDGPREYFMVYNDLWAAAGAPDDGFLCIGCLERRLGRALDHRDFCDCPCNEEKRNDSDRLRMRKAHPEESDAEEVSWW